jgi:hypothetical protein
MSGLIFLSYRRSDTAGYAGRLADDLAEHFGAEEVFRDIGRIEAGSDFVDALDHALASAKVVLVLIGRDWLDEVDGDGRRRLDDDRDFVRREVAAALARDDVTVFPVLLQKASMPEAAELPEPLRALARRQAIEISESRWRHDLLRLVRAIRKAGVGRTTRLPNGRSLTAWSVSGVLITALAGLIWWFASTPSLSDYTGIWHLPNGSFWTVRLVGDEFTIDETHYQSKQVWKRGSAQLDNATLSAELELVFDRRPHLYRYRLTLSPDRHSLIGDVTDTASGGTSTVTLFRRNARPAQ